MLGTPGGHNPGPLQAVSVGSMQSFWTIVPALFQTSQGNVRLDFDTGIISYWVMMEGLK